MPRCDGCGNKRCSCVLVDGDNTQVLGAGSAADPYRVNVDLEGVAGASRITGEMIAFAGGTPPTGWLMCNGAAVSRTTYAALFAVCGETYGEGDGSNTFNLPDLAGRFPFGADGSHDRGTAGGVETITLTTGNLPAHTHTMAHTHGMLHAHGMSHTHDMAHGHGNTGGMSANAAHHHTVKSSPQTNTTVTGGGNRIVNVGSGSDSGNTENTNTDHTHAVAAFAGSTGGDSRGGATENDNRGGVTDGASAGATGSTGSATPYTNMPPYTAVSYIIKT
jgi:microcystin-dependent protein